MLAPARKQWPSWQRLALLNIMLLAVCLRVYRLDEQSVWFDEMNSFLLDPAASFGAFMRHIREVNADHVPLYFVMLFAWGKLAGSGMLGLRLLSIGFACLSIPFLYLSGKKLYGQGAGLLAALCFALSPLNVYESQSIRCYAVVIFLSAVSIWTTLQVAEDRRWRWVLMQAVVNSLLVFTHLSACFLVFFEYLFLLYLAVSSQRGLRERAVLARLLVWAVVHAPAAVYCVFWFTAIDAKGVTWYELPSLGAWLTDLLGDDAVYLSEEFRLTPLPLEIGAAPGTLHWLAGMAYLVLMGSALLWGTYQFARNWRTQDIRFPRAGRELLLLLVLAGPLLIMTLLSFGWHAVVLPRYTLYSSLALYMLVGAMLCEVRGPVLRGAAVALLVAVYTPQLALVLPNQTRSNWIGAGARLQADTGGSDPVLVLCLMDGWKKPLPMPADLLRYNMPPTGRPIYTAHTFHGVLDMGLAMLHGSAGAPPRRHVWVLIEELSNFTQKPHLEAALEHAGIAFEHWQSTNLHLYRLTKATNTPPVTMPLARALGPDDAALLQTLAPSLAESPHRDEALRALRWAVPALPLKPDWFARLELGVAMLELSPETAQAFALQELSTAPGANAGQLLLGLAQLAQGNLVDAQRAFQMESPEVFAAAVQYLPGPDTWRWPGMEALVAGNYTLARAQIREATALSPSRLPPFFRYLVGLEATPPGSKLTPLTLPGE